jgi:hypothetical protein
MSFRGDLSKSETDWARQDAMTDADIDLSDCPEVTSEMFAGAVVRRSVNNRARVTVTITYGRASANDSETLPDQVEMF